MEEFITITSDIAVPLGEIWFTASRSGGPGGQHVNKTSSRVTLHWNVAETKSLSEEQKTRVVSRLAARMTPEGILQFSVDTERSLHQNRRIAAERLASMIRAALIVPKKRVPTKISMSANLRRLRDKARASQLKRRRMAPGAEE